MQKMFLYVYKKCQGLYPEHSLADAVILHLSWDQDQIAGTLNNQ